MYQNPRMSEVAARLSVTVTTTNIEPRIDGVGSKIEAVRVTSGIDRTIRT